MVVIPGMLGGVGVGEGLLVTGPEWLAVARGAPFAPAQPASATTMRPATAASAVRREV
jgi:hypothetical protein